MQKAVSVHFVMQVVYGISIRWNKWLLRKGMANRTKGVIQVGIGQEFACSEEGGGLIQELGFV